MQTVLVANRGEVATRIIDAVHDVGMKAVAVCTDDDRAHTRRADEVATLNGTGTDPYLDVDQIVGAALNSGASLLHPGYGFLSENSDLADACSAAGITFVGPPAEALQIFGDKSQARSLAESLNIPVVPATRVGPSLQEAEDLLRASGAVMVKASAGGGGRGLRRVVEVSDLPVALEECSREAAQYFGSGEFFVEEHLTEPRHIEIQVIGDGKTHQHLWERDCSVQRRHQKLIEIAPSPNITETMREAMVEAALAIAAKAGLTSLCTVEFLVSGNRFFFMEVNPRLQVEHTVTEEITGLDLVALQLRLATGASLAELDLSEPPAVDGFALQARLNAERIGPKGEIMPSAGRLETFAPPTGRYVRVDTALRPGETVNPRFDSLIAKIIGRAKTFTGAADVVADALEDLRISPIQTNRALLHAILKDDDFRSGEATTAYFGTSLERLLTHTLPNETDDLRPEKSQQSIPGGAVAIRAPLAGVVTKIAAEEGDEMSTAQEICVIEAMKMEHLIRPGGALRVDQITVESGSMVEAGDLLAYGAPLDDARAAEQSPASPENPDDADGGWHAEVEEIERRKELAKAHGGAEKVSRQRESGKLTARERIAVLADEDSFDEIGPLAGFGTYDDDGNLIDFRASNYLVGTAKLRGRTSLLGIDDFTIRGGSGDAAVHTKQIFAEQLAGEMRVPMIRILDGASGGGSVKKVLEARAMYLPVNPGWDHVVDNMSRVPVVSVCAGPTVGLGAARFVMSHFGVLVEGIGQLFTAGPPVVKAATGEDLDKEGLGGPPVHRTNGTVERFVGSEEEAYATVRSFLSYLPQSVDHLPPTTECSDPIDRTEESLISAVPRDARKPYAIEPILEAVFDRGSVFKYADYGDGTYTALARLDGHPVGVITADPKRGATLSREGAQAVERLVDLCETFHLPIVSLTDQAGMTIGSAAERAATIRAGARALTAVYDAKVPQAEIILRRVYGVGGAGIVNRHRAVRSWAWPSGDWGSLPPQGGIEAAFRAELSAHPDPEKRLAEITHEMELVSSRFRTAETFSVQDIIDPRTTRRRLCAWAADAYEVLPRLVGPPSFGVRP